MRHEYDMTEADLEKCSRCGHPKFAHEDDEPMRCTIVGGYRLPRAGEGTATIKTPRCYCPAFTTSGNPLTLVEMNEIKAQSVSGATPLHVPCECGHHSTMHGSGSGGDSRRERCRARVPTSVIDSGVCPCDGYIERHVMAGA